MKIIIWRDKKIKTSGWILRVVKRTLIEQVILRIRI